jgi:small conductance mechanosensitive channel
MDVGKTWQFIIDNAIYFGMKVVGAIVIWIIGRWLIGIAARMAGAALDRQKVDPTLKRYLSTVISVTLTVILIVALLGFFGVETTSFAAIVAAAGIAIGMSWSGLLANFAAGAFMMVLRPFKAGDFVTAAGVTGTIKEIGMFITAINTPDNVLTMIGNNKIFSETIQNFTANPYRRVDLKAQLNGSVDPADAARVLKEHIARIPNVLSDPPVDVEILEYNMADPVLAVRPYCHNDNYWQVYFDTNKAIRAAFGAAGFPVSEQQIVIRRER